MPQRLGHSLRMQEMQIQVPLLYDLTLTPSVNGLKKSLLGFSLLFFPTLLSFWKDWFCLDIENYCTSQMLQAEFQFKCCYILICFS